ncbi:hypothetical protein [Akkermansia sp.]|uniref:hypothetical protein n=1 Tax=Akkermansia sp. TaxID=1872421 RepID=UPI0025C10953|nr:hypothetical protein [Akkermansia sp.]MCC8147668.1 hypothetical protein [Akkermansia sp.]
MTTPISPQPPQKNGYPTREELVKLLKLGLLTAISGSLAACVQQQQGQMMGGAPLPPPVKIIPAKGK